MTAEPSQADLSACQLRGRRSAHHFANHSSYPHSPAVYSPASVFRHHHFASNFSYPAGPVIPASHEHSTTPETVMRPGNIIVIILLVAASVRFILLLSSFILPPMCPGNIKRTEAPVFVTFGEIMVQCRNLRSAAPEPQQGSNFMALRHCFQRVLTGEVAVAGNRQFSNQGTIEIMPLFPFSHLK